MIMKRKILGLLLLLFVAQFGRAIQVRFPSLTGVVGDTLTVPLYVDDDLSGSNVVSFQLDIGYTSSNVQILGISSVGTVSNSFGTLSVKNSINHFSITGAGTSALTGKGILLNVKLVLLSSGSSLQFLNGVTSNYFNEGNPVMTFTNGYISISAKPIIYVSPSTVIMNVGEVQQFSGSGGTAPYSWSVSDNTLATIAADGKLTAIKNGLVKVVATDNKGYKGESAFIDCRSFSAAIRDTSFYQNNFIEIPVILTNFDATPMLSGKFTFSFAQSVVSIDSVVIANSILASKANVQVLKSNGKTTVSFAGTTGITASGVLFKLRFKIADAPSGGTYINIDEALINESYVPKVRNCYFFIKPLPALYISPGSNEMFAGDSKQFTVSGGTQPYTWSVENNTTASTSTSGNVTALSGGNTRIIVKDVFGSNTSANLTIYDTWVNVRDTSAIVTQKSITIPIDLGNLPAGKGLFSLSGKAASSFPKIDSIKIINSGTLTNNWQLANKTMKNQANFAVSGTVPITNSGKIALIRIYLNSSIQVGDAFYVDCNELLLNEGNPNVKVKSGYVTIKSIISGINDANYKSNISIYPIPAKTELFINLPAAFSSSEISILDLSGKTLITNILKNYSAEKYIFPIESLGEGFYLLKLQNQQNVEILKFIKK